MEAEEVLAVMIGQRVEATLFEFRLHLLGALRNGVTRAELKEILLQTAVYCGVPAANDAYRVAQEVLHPEEMS